MSEKMTKDCRTKFDKFSEYGIFTKTWNFKNTSTCNDES